MSSSSLASSALKSSSRKRHPLLRLAAYGSAYRRQFLWASFCSILNKVVDLAPPALIGTAVEIVVEQENSFLGQHGISNVSHQLWILAGASFLIWSLESLFQYAYDRLWRNLAQTLQNHLRLDTYDHLQSLDLAFFEERSTGGLMSILNDDLNQLEQFLAGGAHAVFPLATTLALIGGAFFVLSP